MAQAIASVIAAFSTSFTRPTWKKIQVLLIGAILSQGARRITNILRVVDLREEKNYSKFDRVLNQASWSGLAVSNIFLGILIQVVPKSWPIIIAVDQTLKCRRGNKIKAKGAYRDALWYHAGEAPIVLRIVLVKTSGGKNAAEVFFSTDTIHSPTQIIERFVMRWNIEVIFEETRAHLGVETQRQWSDKAIARSTPLLMGLYSILTLIALKMNEKQPGTTKKLN